MGDASDDRERCSWPGRAAGDGSSRSGSTSRNRSTSRSGSSSRSGSNDERPGEVRTDGSGDCTGPDAGGAKTDGGTSDARGASSGPGRSAGASGTDPEGSAAAAGVVAELRTVLRTSVVTGAAVTLPLLITVLVLALAASVVSDVVSPFVVALSWLPVGIDDARTLEALTLSGLLVGMTVVGYVAAYWTGPERLERPVEEVVTAVPGVGPVYETFSKMSEFVVDSDASCFQEVVLVEYPTEGSYALAFETAEPPTAVETAAGVDDMLTVFVPMAPNPVMGGFVLHADPEQVLEVDLTVEEGIQSIVTSGVATGTPVHEHPAALADGDGGRAE